MVLKVLVVGSGGREHALAWALARDGGVEVFAAPGNPGIAAVGRCLPVPTTDILALAATASNLGIDLTVIGPEAPLAAGIADALAARGLRVFGPTAAAAQIEASKVFAKLLMRKWRIPTADFAIFDTPADAVAFVRRSDAPLVIKADGLAGGKGVVVAQTAQEAEAAVVDLMVRRIHGASGLRVVVEEYLEGEEASVMALVRGEEVWPMLPARDYKRARDGDTGPNTGGMGAVAPAPLAPELVGRVMDEILVPTAAALIREDRPYTGVLYAGVMLTDHGPKALEFNCRFGDPETQVILPLLEGSLAEVLLDALGGRRPSLGWSEHAAACVVLASEGYPGRHRTGRAITGVADVPADVRLFHAGTAVSHGALVTAAGRVLNIVGTGPTMERAVSRAYAGVGAVSFEGMQYRADIGATGAGDRRSAVVAISGEVTAS